MEELARAHTVRPPTPLLRDSPPQPRTPSHAPRQPLQGWVCTPVGAYFVTFSTAERAPGTVAVHSSLYVGNASHHQELNHLFVFLLLNHESLHASVKCLWTWRRTSRHMTTVAPSWPPSHEPHSSVPQGPAVRTAVVVVYILVTAGKHTDHETQRVSRAQAPPPPQRGPPAEGCCTREQCLPAPTPPATQRNSPALRTSQVASHSTGLRDSLPSHLSHRPQGPSTWPPRQHGLPLKS